tara:strand:+ start:2337 stop:3404 length:1068 start_codon:yes stop_codon:yes gene_type:complete
MGFVQIAAEDFVISTEAVTNTCWSNNNPTLTEFFTSSIQIATNTGQFYYSVNQLDTTNSESAVQFDVAYCDKQGSGSIWYNPSVNGMSPTRTNYGQYRTLVLGDENASFIFGNYSASRFFAIPVERARYKQSLMPGTWTMCISGSNSPTQEPIRLTDDSLVASSVTFTDAGRVFNMVSGSAGVVNTTINPTGWAGGALAVSGSYGWFLPDIATFLINADAISGSADVTSPKIDYVYNSNVADNNPKYLIQGMAVAGADSSGVSKGFTLNSEEKLSSDFIFIRANNSSFNYSENPSFISGSTGEVVFNEFIDNPVTYITTVGLYNDTNDLLAVAKLSRPLPKDFTKEMLVRVKLDF